MADQQQVDWGANVPIYSPQGDLHAIPQTQISYALAEPGAKRAVPMLAPDGQHHWIPEDQVQDAVQAGGRISFPSQEIPKWFGFTPGNVASNVWSGAKGLVTGLGSLAADLANNPNWFEGSGSTYSKFIGQPAEQEVGKAGQALEQGQPVAAAGHALASAVPMVGPWAAGLGEQAGRGDIGGAAGQAAGVYGAAKVPGVALKAADVVIPSTTRAGAGLNILEHRYAEAPTESAPVVTELNKISNEYGKVGHNLPVEAQTYLNDLAAHDAAANNPALREQLLENGVGDPRTFGDAYRRLNLVNQIIRNSKGFEQTGPEALRVQALKRFAGVLSDQVSAAAEQGGFGKDFQKFSKEYASGSQAIRTGEKVGPYVGGAAGYMAGRALAHQIGPELGIPAFGIEFGAGALGRALGKNAVGGMVRSIVERPGTPQLSSTPPALPTPRPPAPPPDVYTRNLLAQQELLRAKSGEITPGQANANIQRMGVSTRTTRIPTEGEPTIEQIRRGAPGAPPPPPTGENLVPPEARASTVIPRENEAALGQRIAGRTAEKAAMEQTGRQPAPNTPEAAAWHNEALRMAQQKLGAKASLSDIRKEAARIQQAGPPKGWKLGPPPPPTR